MGNKVTMFCSIVKSRIGHRRLVRGSFPLEMARGCSENREMGCGDGETSKT